MAQVVHPQGHLTNPHLYIEYTFPNGDRWAISENMHASERFSWNNPVAV